MATIEHTRAAHANLKAKIAKQEHYARCDKEADLPGLKVHDRDYLRKLWRAEATLRQRIIVAALAD